MVYGLSIRCEFIGNHNSLVVLLPTFSLRLIYRLSCCLHVYMHEFIRVLTTSLPLILCLHETSFHLKIRRKVNLVYENYAFVRVNHVFWISDGLYSNCQHVNIRYWTSDLRKIREKKNVSIFSCLNKKILTVYLHAFEEYKKQVSSGFESAEQQGWLLCFVNNGATQSLATTYTV